MIYGKIWLHVKPATGIPLFLGACAVGSFAVHTAILTNTTWVKRFLEGGGVKKSAQVESQSVAQVPIDTTVIAAAAPRAPN